MEINDNGFFREVTLRICGSLNIEKGLQACIEYLAHYMPVNFIVLQTWERDLDAFRIIALSSAGKAERMNMLIPLTKKAKKECAQGEQALKDGLPPVYLFNNTDESPTHQCILRALGEPSMSAMNMPLVVEDELLGFLSLTAEGNNRFNDSHLKLYATLKEPFFIALSNALKHREIIKLKEMLTDDNRFLHQEIKNITGDQIIGENSGLKNVMDMARQVATLDSSVLLLGETGVGKDVIANAIHYSSARTNGPLIKVNCGAIPGTLIDSELFGHEKGAYTGAISKKRGRFERAHNGTIFLDEIAELPLQAQVGLLRVLQSKEIERVGGSKTINLDIRVIAATHQNLEEMIKTAQFREDLWFRLNVFPIVIPPLRQRKEDIPELVRYFIERKSKDLKLPDYHGFAAGTMDLLVNYDWPGNVRELENVIERALIMNRSGPLDLTDFFPKQKNRDKPFLQEKDEELLELDKLISLHIQRAITITNGRIHGPKGAAGLLGINPNTLRSKIRKLGVKKR